VTSQSSPFMRFPRALDRGNLTEVLSAGSDLEHIGLTEALELCVLLRDKAPDRYGPAALRWHGRFCREVDSRVQCRCRRPHPQRENALCRKASRSSRQRRFQGRALAVAKLREAIRAVEQAREEAIAALGIEQWAKVFPHEDAGAGHLRLNLLKGGRLSKAMPNVTTITVATSVLQWLLDDAAWLGAPSSQTRRRIARSIPTNGPSGRTRTRAARRWRSQTSGLPKVSSLALSTKPNGSEKGASTDADRDRSEPEADSPASIRCAAEETGQASGAPEAVSLAFLCPGCGTVQDACGACRRCEARRTRSRLRTEPHRLIYRTSHWRRARARALARDADRCADCGNTGALEVHHRIPLA
jgi:hypothetical protein